jgi:hypothetical protein
MGHSVCTEPQCLYNGALYLYFTVELYLYSPYGLYGLYRTSVPVQGVHFTFILLKFTLEQATKAQREVEV